MLQKSTRAAKDPERAHGEWVPRARAVGAVTGGAGMMAELDQVPLLPRGGRWGERRASDGADGRKRGRRTPGAGAPLTVTSLCDKRPHCDKGWGPTSRRLCDKRRGRPVAVAEH